MVANVKRWLGSDPVDIGLRIVVAITVLISLVLYINQQRLANCQFRYNQAYAEYSKAYEFAESERTRVQNELFKATHDARVRNNEKTQKDIDAAFVAYFTTMDLMQKQVEEHPPPKLPNDFC